MSDGPTPRQLARAENLDRIKRLALEQLAEAGAATLSLRAIARELNLVSSAIYRYYPSRDHLITDLIMDAYSDLADVLEQAGDTRRGARRRWSDVCLALREWAVAEPHRFGLIYGSAVPGYVAPPDTVAPAGRVIHAVASPVGPTSRPPGPIPRTLLSDLVGISGDLDLEVDPETMLTLVGAFARLIGLLTMELNGHFVGGFEPADTLFATLVEREADALGL